MPKIVLIDRITYSTCTTRHQTSFFTSSYWTLSIFGLKIDSISERWPFFFQKSKQGPVGRSTVSANHRFRRVSKPIRLYGIVNVGSGLDNSSHPQWLIWPWLFSSVFLAPHWEEKLKALGTALKLEGTFLFIVQLYWELENCLCYFFFSRKSTERMVSCFYNKFFTLDWYRNMLQQHVMVSWFPC